jgi:hypothetical protein
MKIPRRINQKNVGRMNQRIKTTSILRIMIGKIYIGTVLGNQILQKVIGGNNGKYFG